MGQDAAEIVMPDLEYENIAEEEAYAQELAFAQAEQEDAAEIESLRETGQSFGHPSYLKYGLLFLLAGIIDIMGVVELDPTFAGWFLAKLVTVPCYITMFAISWFTSTKHKEAQEYVKTLEERFEQIGTLARVGIKQTAKFLGRNPKWLVAIGGGLDLVLPPFLSLLNLSTVWVYIAYRSEKRAYRHASETAENLPELT